MSEYLIVLSPVRPTFPGDGTPEEHAAVGRHFHYLQQAQADGKLWFAGRTMDEPPMGLVVVTAQDDAEAMSFMQSDPAIVAGVFVGQLRPYAVALWRASALEDRQP